jgi:photosystem II stability/assembly factor-like uncharacterized protein
MIRSSLTGLVLALLASAVAGCSSSSTTQAAADGGADTDAGNADAAAPNPFAAYEQAVMASSWAKLPGAPSQAATPKSQGGKQDDIFFTSPAVGYTASGFDGIFKTTDGGKTWANAFTHAGTFFRSVLFLDDSHGFAGNLGAGLAAQISDATVLYETKDAGKTWAPVTAITGPAPQGICNLTKVDAQHLFAVGRANGPAHVLASSDGGATWTSTDLGPQMSMLIDAHFSSPTEGLIAGQNAGSPAVCTILRTTDGGKTYAKVFSSKTSGSLCWKLSFPTADVGYVAVQDESKGPPTFGKTTDGGKTWTESPLPVKAMASGGFPAIGIGFVTPNVGWVSPEDSALASYRTTDGGQTWTVDTALKAPINRFRFVDKNTAYAIGADIWKMNITYSGN